MDAVNEFVAFKPEAVSAFVDAISGPWIGNGADPQAFVRCVKELFDKGAVTVKIMAEFPSEDAPAPKTRRCRVCGDHVAATEMRDHLCRHNAGADAFDWNDMISEFDVIVPADAEAEEGHVLVTCERYSELLAGEAKLTALEAAGVDNWDGYDFAMESLQKQ